MNIVDEYIKIRNYKLHKEKTYCNKEWWYIESLIAAVQTSPTIEYDLDLKSIDLGVMPWDIKNAFQLIQHMIDMELVDMSYPVMIAPGGWVLNGWHRVVRAIMERKDSIKAIRFLELPDCDGTDE